MYRRRRWSIGMPWRCRRWGSPRCSGACRWHSTTHDAQVVRFRQLRPVVDWVRLQNCGGAWASLWLSTPPAEHGLSLLDVEYASMVRWRAQVPLQAGECALCGRALDPFGDHAQAYPRGTLAWILRHHSTQASMQHVLRWAGLTVSRGPVVPGLPHIPDLLAEAYWPLFGCRTSYLPGGWYTVGTCLRLDLHRHCFYHTLEYY